MSKEERGFASMDSAKQREIASKGGRAAHQKGTAHEWTREEAREAGRKGGMMSRGHPVETVNGAISPRASSINMPDEDFTSIEAAVQVVEKFTSRLTVGDAEGHVRRSVDELCAAVTKKEGIEPAVNRLLRGLRGLDDARAARRRRDFGRESLAVDRLLDAVQEELLPTLRRVGYQV